MELLFRGLMAAGVLLACKLAHAQEASTSNSAYEQLPAAWDASQPPSVVAPMQATASDAEILPSPDASQSPTLASAYASPQMAPGYVTPASVICGDGVAFGAYPPHSFWYANAELTVLHPSYDNVIFALDSDRGAVAPRLIFGWESPRGLGFRSRFWWLDYESEVISEMPFLDGEEAALDALRIDLDAYRRFTFDGSSIALGGGVTIANMGWELEGVEMKDAGVGASFFVEGRHELARTPVGSYGVVGRGRWAALAGEWRSPEFDRPRGDSTINILEAGFGWDMVRTFGRCDLVFQHLIEVQGWESTLVQDISFFGQSISLGLRW